MHSESRYSPSVFVFCSFNPLKFQCDPVLLAAELGRVMSVQALLRSALLLPPRLCSPTQCVAARPPCWCCGCHEVDFLVPL